MDPTSIAFLILLVAMGGGIAWLADIVGKKLGKKRLSFMGLRPRQTASLGTISVGVLITGFTLFVVLIGNSSMRQTLLRGAKIRQDLETDQRELQEVRAELKSRSDSNVEQDKANKKLKSEVAKNSEQLEDRKKALVDANNKLSVLNARISQLQPKIDHLTKDVSAKVAALKTSQGKLATASNRLVEIQLELKNDEAKLDVAIKQNKEFADQDAQYVTSIDGLKAAQTQLVAENTRLEKDAKRLHQDVDSLQSAESLLQSEIDPLKSQKAKLEEELASAKSALANTRADFAEVSNDVDFYKGISLVSRRQPMIFRMDEELVRLAVPANLSASQARGALVNLIRRARIVAQARGATRHGRFLEAGIFSHNSGDGQKAETITPEQIEASIVKQITGSPDSMVLIASSSLNAFRGESVSLEVRVLPNPLVYKAGQLVAEALVDGSRGDAVIYQEFTAFLQDKVREKAQKDGMIPIRNSDISFGEISQADVLQTIGQLRTANRPIRLQAHAAGDTLAADPLKLEFRLR